MVTWTTNEHISGFLQVMATALANGLATGLRRRDEAKMTEIILAWALH